MLDTGNMEVFTVFGTDEHKEKYLKPLLEGRSHRRSR